MNARFFSRRRALAGTAALALLPLAGSAACDPEGVALLAGRLRGGAEVERREAAGALGRCGAGAPAAVPALVAALADLEPRVRESAAAALGEIGAAAADAIPALIAACADENAYLGGAAAVALARIGAASVPALIEALADPRENVRWSAAVALGRLGPAAATAAPALARALDDAQATVRGTAAYALGALGAAAGTAVPALVERLSDRDEDVRRAARSALAEIAPVWRTRLPARAEVVATIERLVPELMAEHHVPGVSIALIDGGEVAWAKPYGVVDVRSRAPVTRETIFEAASMSKPVFALLALRLVEARRLDLDRPLADVAPEVSVPDQPEKRRVTARMALSHTSGYPNWRPGEEEREGPLPLLFEPGARFGYSGEGIYLLQRAVERITGKELDLLARSLLFEPLGLTRSSFVWTPEIESVLASGHGEEGSFLARSKYTHPNAAYTLYASAEEYARILVEVLHAVQGRSKLLSERSAREMLRSQVDFDAREPIERPATGEGRSVHWGLGWSINTTRGGEIFHHSGANRTGFRCFSQFSVDRRSGLVILTNGLGGGELWTRLVAAVGDW